MDRDILYRNSINSLIARVFNYYNGRINVCNNAVLEIYWVNKMGSDILGSTRNPNIVTIYPSIAGRYSQNQFNWIYNLCSTVIHELYHIDQVIDYRMMASDPSYVQRIEYAVEVQTNLYIANHLNEISMIGMLDITNYDYNGLNAQIERYDKIHPYYCRRTPHTHLLVVLREIVADFNVFTQVSNQLNIARDFYLTINGKTIKVKSDGMVIPPKDLNEFVYNNFYQYMYRVFSYRYENGNQIIVEADLKHIMCH